VRSVAILCEGSLTPTGPRALHKSGTSAGSQPMTASDSPAIRIGAWRADPALDEISKDGTTVKIERRAMQLLLYLSQHADQVVSVEQLLDEVWAGVVVTPDSVYHGVAALRRLLGDDSKQPTYIANVPRRGYRLIAPVAPWVGAPHLQIEDLPLPAVESGHAILAVKTTGLPWRRFAISFASALTLALGYVLLDRFWLSKHAALVEHRPTDAATVVADRTIAVLPFVDLSEKKDQEYFADGMAEEILNLLTKIHGLTVIGRTSSFQFKGKNEDLRTIGTKLNAAYLLEGSVRKFGDQVRITVQLINTQTGTQVWSDTYDRHVGDVLKLQEAIALAVARELQLAVAPRFLSSGSSVKNAEAYDLYLRGLHADDRSDSEGADEAASLYQHALDLDPTFTDAAVALADTYLFQVGVGGVAPQVGFEQARRGAAAALRLDPNNAEAHALLGYIHILYDWDWAAAGRELQRAMTLDSGNVDAQFAEATLSYALGHWDDALRKINAALAQDPLNVSALNLLAEIQATRGDPPEAEAAMRRVLDIRPTFAYGHYNLGIYLLERGDLDGALREMQQEKVDDGKQQGLALAYYAQGRKAEADAALTGMLRGQPDRYALDIAEVYAFRGQSDEALHWLEQAYAQKNPYLYSIKSDWLLKNLESDPRYKAFLGKMNLPE
jgi:TolB-like protein/DNA-binding winged helix-turn-helix (wHTH) protein/Flp pilus assembly protein TadD